MTLICFGCSESGGSRRISPKATSPARTDKVPQYTEDYVSNDAKIVLNWTKSNQVSVNAFGSAVDLFESEIMAGNTSDNRGVARAVVILYNALVEMPLQPSNIPHSRQFNRAINQLTIVMENMAKFAIANNYEKMLAAGLEYQSARNLYDAWLRALSQE